MQIPAWAFDHGNVRVFTQEYADAGPMVAYGGNSPVFVEYEFEVPGNGAYELAIEYAAATERAVELLLDGSHLTSLAPPDYQYSWDTRGVAEGENRVRPEVTP